MYSFFISHISYIFTPIVIIRSKRNIYKKNNISIIDKGITILAAVLTVGAIAASVIFLPAIAATVVSIVAGIIIPTAGVVGCHYANKELLKLKENIFRSAAEAQLKKSNKVLATTVGKAVLRASESELKQDSFFKKADRGFEAKIAEEPEGIGTTGLRLAKLEDVSAETITSTKLKGISKGGKTLNSRKNETILSTYTKEYLEDTNKLKKSLLQNLGDVNTNPNQALRPSETSNTEKPDLIKGAFR